MQTVYVSASELAEYIYCQCCWADRLEGLQVQTLAMKKGIDEHDQIQGRYFLSVLLKRVAILFVGASLATLLIMLFLRFVLQFNLW